MMLMRGGHAHWLRAEILKNTANAWAAIDFRASAACTFVICKLTAVFAAWRLRVHSRTHVDARPQTRFCVACCARLLSVCFHLTQMDEEGNHPHWKAVRKSIRWKWKWLTCCSPGGAPGSPSAAGLHPDCAALKPMKGRAGASKQAEGLLTSWQKKAEMRLCLSVCLRWLSPTEPGRPQSSALGSPSPPSNHHPPISTATDAACRYWQPVAIAIPQVSIFIWSQRGKSVALLC